MQNITQYENDVKRSFWTLHLLFTPAVINRYVTYFHTTVNGSDLRLLSLLVLIPQNYEIAIEFTVQITFGFAVK